MQNSTVPEKSHLHARGHKPTGKGAGDANFSEVKRVTIAQSITEQIIAMIADGHYKPGDKLPTEIEMMEYFNVGRSSVREAIRGLTFIGVLNRRPYHGTTVAIPSSDLPVLKAKNAIAEWALRDLFDARAVIEGRAAFRAATMATDAELDRIEELAKRVEKKISKSPYIFKENNAFHRAIVEAGHNRVLLHLFDEIIESMRDVRSRFSTARDIEEHRGILEALRQRDPEAARFLLERHIRTVVSAAR